MSANRAARRRYQAEFRRCARHPNVADASAADAAWFAAHPQRSHRIRPAMARELPGLDDDVADVWICIRQAAPGLRFRSVFTDYGTPLDSEAFGHAMFDTLAECARKGSVWGTRISGRVIFERAMAMASGGRA